MGEDQLTNLGLVDEYPLLVYPLIMGKGKPLFKEVGDFFS
jgi:dihydrofolate reductase